MYIKLPAEVSYILNRLTHSGFEAYLVGGCVRDSILGREPKDWDITTDALPEQVTEIFTNAQYSRVIPTGVEHGTVTVLVIGKPFEVTTFRKDGKYSDGRRPDRVKYTTSIQADLARRDFTMNAIAYRPLGGVGELLDPFGGVKSIERGIISCVGLPERRLEEDALRMLRAFRFSAQLGFQIADSVRHAIQQNSDKLAGVSQERIRDEFVKIISSDVEQAVRVLNEMYDVGLLEEFLPELSACHDIPQNNRFHAHDLWEHIMEAFLQAPDDLEIRLAILFHDLGKVSTHTVDEDGYDHFYGHAEVSAEITRDVMKRLRFRKEEIDAVSSLVEFHQLRIQPTEKLVRRALNKIAGRCTLRDLLLLQEADDLAKNLSNSQVNDRLGNLRLIPQVHQKILDEEQAFSLKDLCVDGRDVLNAGVEPGKTVGFILSKLLELVIDEPGRNNRQDLLLAIQVMRLCLGENNE